MSPERYKEKKPSLVTAPVAALLSFFVPGLGQIMARRVQRGLLMLGAMVTIIGLFIWRVNLLGRRVDGFWPTLSKALERNTFFISFTILAIVALWVWIVYDAVKQTRKGKQYGNAIFALILLVFFGIGWQISEIDIVKLTSDANEAWLPLSKILWPWDAAVTRSTESLEAGAEVLVDSEGPAPPKPERVEGEPYVWVEPREGELSRLDDDNNIIPGTEITVYGEGFAPETRTEIWWSDAIGNEFQPRYQGRYVSTVTDEEGNFEMTMNMPYRLVPPSARGQQIHKVIGRQVSEVGPLLPSDPLVLTIELIIETIFMGMMATLFGIVFSVPVSFLAARNLMSSSWITLLIYYITRTILNIVRAIEPLIWALIAVVWVGLGPFAGIVALTIHSIAALGKLYSESIESINPGPIEAIQATGATKLQTIMFAVVPQMIPPFVSFTIYRWDINVRMSTVIGMVGGGGIGFLLVQYIRLLEYKSAGIAVWFIALTVAILDYVSAEIRQRFV
ncbi:MAG TPA: phosphonate ABC transporter, permease protein PhnE [Sediminispirochaeta sp.]|nr:phosphonate ABC transporter, permease protein PhnE [Sediminispirochaeta sp.]